LKVQTPTPDSPQVAFVQDGARLHYAIPLSLQRAGMLERVFCDWYSGGRAERLAEGVLARTRPDLARKLKGRFAPELDIRKVAKDPWPLLRRLRRGTPAGGQEANEWYSAQIMQSVLKKGFASANLLMGFIRHMHPELCAQARRSGMVVVGDQIIAPAAEEGREDLLQRERFSGWQDETVANDYPALDRFERQTWEHLDHVTCASDYVKRGLIAHGVEEERISVLPYPIDARHVKMSQREQRSVITVGFVGAVSLRKGAPYFLEVARRLASPGLRFVMVGPVQISADVVAKHGGAVELVGSVPRAEVTQWLERFDILFFPSTCEGSAGSLMEAMASGLPVVTSPNSGTVARDGVEGYLAAYDDLEMLSSRLHQLAEDEALRRSMGTAARKRAEEFSLDWYSNKIASLLRQLLRPRIGAAG
jgi:hypothetical protein